MLIITAKYRLVLVSLIFALAFSELSLYTYTKKLKLKRFHLIALLIAYLSSLVITSIKSKNFIQDFPVIVLFFIVIFSGKTYFEFFQSFQNFNQV